MKALYELQSPIPGNGEERNTDAWTLVLMLICEQSLPVLAIAALFPRDASRPKRGNSPVVRYPLVQLSKIRTQPK